MCVGGRVDFKFSGQSGESMPRGSEGKRSLRKEMVGVFANNENEERRIC